MYLSRKRLPKPEDFLEVCSLDHHLVCDLPGCQGEVLEASRSAIRVCLTTQAAPENLGSTSWVRAALVLFVLLLVSFARFFLRLSVFVCLVLSSPLVLSWFLSCTLSFTLPSLHTAPRPSGQPGEFRSDFCGSGCFWWPEHLLICGCRSWELRMCVGEH